MLSENEYNRILSLTDGKDYGLMPPPMTDKAALDELRSFFLGDDWYTVNPMGREQVNTEMVMTIESLIKSREQGKSTGEN